LFILVNFNKITIKQQLGCNTGVVTFINIKPRNPLIQGFVVAGVGFFPFGRCPAGAEPTFCINKKI
jgi:hypothetical protein